RRVPRTPVQTPLELGNPSLEPLVRLDQPLIRNHQPVEPQQQNNSRLAITIEDRLRLSPLHTKPFATRPRAPAPPEYHEGGTSRRPGQWAFGDAVRNAKEVPVTLSVGIDWAYRRAAWCARSSGGAISAEGFTPADEDGLARLVLQLGRNVTACVEMMSGAVWVRDQLRSAGWRVEVADARRVKGIAPLA